MVRNFGGQPSLSRICHSLSCMLIVSNALVKSINKCYIQCSVFLLTFLLELPEKKHHVGSAPVGSEATLALREMIFSDSRHRSV